jgi:hypothetical protein
MHAENTPEKILIHCVEPPVADPSANEIIVAGQWEAGCTNEVVRLENRKSPLSLARNLFPSGIIPR